MCLKLLLLFIVYHCFCIYRLSNVEHLQKKKEKKQNNISGHSHIPRKTSKQNTFSKQHPEREKAIFIFRKLFITGQNYTPGDWTTVSICEEIWNWPNVDTGGLRHNIILWGFSFSQKWISVVRGKYQHAGSKAILFTDLKFLCGITTQISMVTISQLWGLFFFFFSGGWLSGLKEQRFKGKQ